MHIFLSYPKSGRTWVRFMVDSYLCRLHSLDVPNVFEVEKRLSGVPGGSVEWTHLTGAMILRQPYWRMGRLELGEGKRWPWLLLVRNFQATLRSAYFQARDRVRVFQGTPSEFLRSPQFGAIKLVTFYNIWTEQVRDKVAGQRVFSYEQVLADPAGQLTKILEALDLPIHTDWVAAVVADASFDRMKELGLSPAYGGTPLAPMDASRPETYKVRQGNAKDELFTADDKAYIDRVVHDLLIAKDEPMFASCLDSPKILTTAPVKPIATSAA